LALNGLRISKQIRHSQADRIDDIFSRAAGLTIEQRPPVIAFRNRKTRASIVMGGTSRRPAGGVWRWVAIAFSQSCQEFLCGGHYELPAFLRSSIQLCKSATEYRTHREILTWGISPDAFKAHSFLGEIAKAALASAGVISRANLVCAFSVFMVAYSKRFACHNMWLAYPNPLMETEFGNQWPMKKAAWCCTMRPGIVLRIF